MEDNLEKKTACDAYHEADEMHLDSRLIRPPDEGIWNDTRNHG